MYSPKIKEDLIPELFKLSKQKGKPMIHLVDEILRKELQQRGCLCEAPAQEKVPKRKKTKEIPYFPEGGQRDVE